jgi:hypothetical protein
MTSARLAIALAIASTTFAARAGAQDRERCVAAFDQGQSHRLRGGLRAARASFLTCAADACPVPLRKDCVQALSDLDAELPTIVLGARDGSGRDVIPTAAYVDDERVTALDGRALAEDPGPHVIRFEHPPNAPVVERVVLRMGERNRTILATFASPAAPTVSGADGPARASREAPPPADASRPMGWVYATGALGVVGIASFAIFGVAGFVEKQHLMDRCAPSCADSDVARVRFDYITGDVSLGVGVVSLGVAAYLLLSSPSRAPAVSVVPSKDGVVVGYGRSF